MCGIFAVLREPSSRTPPSTEWIRSALGAGSHAATTVADDPVVAFTTAARHLSRLNEALKGTAGVEALVSNVAVISEIEQEVSGVEKLIAEVERDLDAGGVPVEVSLEGLNQALVALKDVAWFLTRDRVRTARAVLELGGNSGLSHSNSVLPHSAIEAYSSIQLALSAIDRLEVRGRDSAGLSVLVSRHGIAAPELDQMIAGRADPLFLSGAVERAGDSVVFVYKAAAEIGALGDNVRHIRHAITRDSLFRDVVSRPGAEVAIVSHTRWASVGTISQANASPIDSQVTAAGEQLPCVVAALNGDVDNYAELRQREHISVADEITTDVKVIPVMVGKRIASGAAVVEAFRTTVDQFQGSVAIAAAVVQDPSRLLFAVRGSGQGCYIGLAENAFLVASEPYGLVEECSQYIRLDGDAVAASGGKNGQVVELLREGAGTLQAIRRISYGGEALPVGPADLVNSEITTRDIDRGGAPHFLLKEIGESPQSVLRTLRGKIVEVHGRLRVTLPEETLPKAIIDALKANNFKQIIAIGQGTARVASRSLAAVLERIAPTIPVVTKAATELSGFGLRDDMSDTLIVAVSQSGTTTDTNRTVDLVRSRGAKVIAIVNRRQSDLTEKADGVFYTSDGRDLEMSVASTKAFYAQVTAASLLAIALAEASGVSSRQEVHDLLCAFRSLPDAMATVLGQRPEIAEVARKYAPHRRSWAIVGNGPNHIAAHELRIKLSELCYKSIAVDITEDKKHIDLSAEPMVMVCAAGLSGSNAKDVAKEVAIYRAHKAAAIVIASQEHEKYDGAVAVIGVPALHPLVDYMFSTMVGHIFGYEAALAIDAQGRFMRTARAVLDDAIAAELKDDDLLSAVRSNMAAPSAAIFAELNSGALNGHLEPRTAVRVASLLRYATGVFPLDALEVETGRPTSPALMVGDLTAALTIADNELTRPIDAVKHQAKTVTVGISRTEDSFADSALVNEVLAAGAMRDRLSYRSMRSLAALDPSISEIIGFTRYEVEGEVAEGTATIRVVGRGGVAAGIVSRSESDPRLTGTKHRAAYERMVTVGRGQRDGRSVIIVPESKDLQVTGITLLHARFVNALGPDEARGVLTGYRNRYSALVDAVTETEPDFDDEKLVTVPLIDLLVEPVWVLARHWRQAQ